MKTGVDLGMGAKGGVVELLRGMRQSGMHIDRGELDDLIDTALKIDFDDNQFDNLADCLSYYLKSRAVRDARRTDVEDVLKFIAIFFAESIDSVTDRLFRKIGRENAIVPMTMDITDGSDEDWPRFNKQIAGTRLQVLRHPGRVFPFFAVNPARSNMLELAQQALNSGFVGIKLYPSLGYSMDMDEMQELLKLCDRLEAPTLMHCSPVGYHVGVGNAVLCSPEKWGDYLGTYKKLKICFGHFGDEDNFCHQQGIAPNTWTSKIVDLLSEYPGRAFADVSAHTGAAKYLYQYFANLEALIDQETVGNGVLWGTDWPMIRITVSERNYWNLYKEELPARQFDKMAKTNPPHFLGLPGDGLDMQPNIRRYVDYLKRMDIVVDEDTPVWLRGLL